MSVRKLAVSVLKKERSDGVSYRSKSQDAVLASFQFACVRLAAHHPYVSPAVMIESCY